MEFLFVSAVFLLLVSFSTPRWCLSQKAIKKSRVRVFYTGISLFAGRTRRTISHQRVTQRQLPRPVMQEQGAARVESISNSIGEHWTLHSMVHWRMHACCSIIFISPHCAPLSHTASVPMGMNTYLLLGVQARLTIYKVQGGQRYNKMLHGIKIYRC